MLDLIGPVLDFVCGLLNRTLPRDQRGLPVERSA